MIEHKIDMKFVSDGESSEPIKATIAMSEDCVDEASADECATVAGCFDLIIPMDNDDSVTLRGNRDEFVKILKFMEQNSTT